MLHVDSALLDLTEWLCRRFQVLTGRTNVWLAFQLTNFSIVLFFVWAGMHLVIGGRAFRIALAAFCGGLLYLLTQTLFKVPVETYEHNEYRRVSRGLRNPRRVRDALLRIAFLTFSSDLVFGRGHDRPIVESATPAPLNAYGWSKAHAERRVLQAMPEALVARTAAFITPEDDGNFLSEVLGRLERGEEVQAADDLVVSPTHVRDLAHIALDLLIDGERGLWHLANRGEVSWAALARTAAEMAELDPSLVTPVPARELGLRAERPSYSALGSERASIMPALDDALARCIAARLARLDASQPAVALTAADPAEYPVDSDLHAIE